jgi:DNA-binding transcriptional LysR family regulator
VNIAMDLRQLRQLVVLAETLNFRRAAERLHIAQPPLSISIRRLEESLDARLFERGRRGVRLTEAGRAALPDARLAIFHAEQARRAVRTAAAGETGTLRVGFVGSATYALLPRVLPEFRRRFPRVQLELTESTTTRILARVEEEGFDVGIVRYPVVRATPLQLQTIERDVFAAVLPARHRLARSRRLALADLAAEPFVFYSAAEVPGLHTVALLACQSAGFTPQVSQEAVQVQTVVSLVESGFGVALAPSVARRHAPKRVLFRKLSDPTNALAVGLALVYKAETETALVKRFREALRLPA